TQTQLAPLAGIGTDAFVAFAYPWTLHHAFDGVAPDLIVLALLVQRRRVRVAVCFNQYESSGVRKRLHDIETCYSRFEPTCLGIAYGCQFKRFNLFRFDGDGNVDD